jgi:hypothetical protein
MPGDFLQLFNVGSINNFLKVIFPEVRYHPEILS